MQCMQSRFSTSTRYERIILRARSAETAHFLSLTFLSNVVAYACRASQKRIGSMFIPVILSAAKALP